MRRLTEAERRHIIRLIESGEELPPYYKDLLFPPEIKRLKWRFKTSAYPTHEGAVYFGCGDGCVYALDG